MKKLFAVAMVLVLSDLGFVSTPREVEAGKLFNLANLLPGRGMNLREHHCDKCGNAHEPDGPCIERFPVKDCVIGKKKVYDSKICYEYVSIPETRYRWKNKWVTKEIPCPYCKPVCKTEDGEHCFGEEKWEKQCTVCGKLHCKHIETKIEKLPVKRCAHEPDETTIKARYWSCVKEPYLVYRRVKKPVCIKEPRYERVKVAVTRYVCKHCDGGGCGQCGQAGFSEVQVLDEGVLPGEVVE